MIATLALSLLRRATLATLAPSVGAACRRHHTAAAPDFVDDDAPFINEDILDADDYAITSDVYAPGKSPRHAKARRRRPLSCRLLPAIARVDRRHER